MFFNLFDSLFQRAISRADLEVALGLPKGQLQGGRLKRIDIKNPLQYNLRLPEKGNDFFRKGVGLTTDNLNEDIIDSPLKKDLNVSIQTIKGL